MLDTDSLNRLIEQQITEAVTQRVEEVLGQTDWLADIETKVTQHVQDRITARFTNLGSMPDIILTIQSSVARLLKQGHVPGIDRYLDTGVITTAIDASIQDFVQKTMDNLVLDPDWLSKMESSVNHLMTTKLLERLSRVDLDEIILQGIDRNLDRWQEKLREDFRTTGIEDLATNKELTVMDDTVVVEHELVASDAVIENSARVKGTLEVGNFVVRGTINTDNRAWDELRQTIADQVTNSATLQWRRDLVDEVLRLARTEGISFDDVRIDGEALFSDGILNRTIRESHIEKLGVLRELTVNGPTRLSDTVTVIGHRLGVNTQTPDMAVSVWDEEVAISIGKIKERQGYLGTSRSQILSLGTNRQSHLEIDTDGLTTAKKLRIGRHRVDFGNDVPNYSGTRGDIVFNSDPKPNTPFAWVCLGAYKWQSLRSA